MTLLLPSFPSPSSMTMTLVSNSIDMKPTLGGPTQRASRIGSRWQCDVNLPPMSYANAMNWMATLNRAATEIMRLFVVQPDLTGLDAGSVAVNGAGQAGTSLAVSGGTAAYSYRGGQFITLYNASLNRGYLHQLTAGYTLSGAGAGILPIYPAMRSAPLAGSILYQNAPFIDGFLTNPSASWSVDAARTVGLSFSILEAE